jgi:hypothetical protein
MEAAKIMEAAVEVVEVESLPTKEIRQWWRLIPPQPSQP